MNRTLMERLFLLLCVYIVLLFFYWLLSGVFGKKDAVTAAAEPTPIDTMMEATPEPTIDPDSLPKYEMNEAIPLAEDLQFILFEACEANEVDLALALGVIEVESRFVPDADNGLCYGLMQLNRRYFPDNLTAGENIQRGVEYLGQLLARYDAVESALTAYNAGHDTGNRRYANAVLAAAERWRGVI